jgi:large subunit ribosomal protein L7/L12
MKTVCIVIGVAVVVGLLIVLGRGSSSPTNLPQNATDDDVRALAKDGKKIQAIKWYRALHGVGLKEAKDAVEEMM